MIKSERKLNDSLTRLFSQYGMLGVLVLLGLFFSLVTICDQHPTGKAAGEALAKQISTTHEFKSDTERSPVIILAPAGSDADQFITALSEGLSRRGHIVGEVFSGEPAAIRTSLESLGETGAYADTDLLFATLNGFAPITRNIIADIPSLDSMPIATPPSYRWPTFLLTSNLLNVANQIAVIAILAIGMTMVIITAGIDLSVGSLIALSAVVVATLIGHLGGTGASMGAMLICSLGAVTFCGFVGSFSGFVVTRFRVPPFIATLGMMQVASGLAYILSRGRPVYQVPDSFVTLGRGADPLVGIPYAVILMIFLYTVAHLMMSRTTMGRYIYAVGGNQEAAHLAGVRVNKILMFVYSLNGMLAGLGGVVMASQLKSGAPTYGLMYELYVIAAVVVGGTSLSGGEGKILGTLIGAFIIAVIQNGMNLTNVESYTQKVVLGLVILGAVLLDRLKQKSMQKRQGHQG